MANDLISKPLEELTTEQTGQTDKSTQDTVSLLSLSLIC